MKSRLEKDLEFCVLLDKMKTIKRQTTIIGTDGIREDDAQHSFHVAMMAIVMEKYSNEKIDICKCIKMLLIHDLVEIHAGDTPAYDAKANEGKHERELEGVEIIFGMLDDELYKELKELWFEFEANETPEAKFANTMDRVQPILNNIQNDGNTWVKYDATRSDVMRRVAPVKEGSDALWDVLLDVIDRSVEKGFIREDTV